MPQESSGPRFEARSLSCRISLKGKNLEAASHTYNYELVGLSDAPLTSFEWTIPNALPKDVTELAVSEEWFRESSEGNVESKSTRQPTLATNGDGTVLVIPLAEELTIGKRKTLKFSYTARSDADVKGTFLGRTGSYRAYIYHKFRVTDLSLEVELPPGNRIVGTQPPKAIEHGSTAAFKQRDLAIEHQFHYDLFFQQRKTVLVAAISAVVLVAAAALGALMATPSARRYTAAHVKAAEVALGLLVLGGVGALVHSFASGIMHGTYHILRKLINKA